MRKGNSATIRMKKMFRAGDTLDENVYASAVLQYDEKEECIYLQLQSGRLTDLSLDAIYECMIQTEKEQLHCTGRIKKRYYGMAGKTFKFEIENGFYKINLK